LNEGVISGEEGRDKNTYVGYEIKSIYGTAYRSKIMRF